MTTTSSIGLTYLH
jgi:hypothetical protein